MHGADETGPGELPHTRQRGNRITFDPTINAGHILTFITLLCALAAGWTTLDKRVVVLEEARGYQVRRDDAQDEQIGEKFTEIREAVKDIRHGIDELRRDGAKKP